MEIIISTNKTGLSISVVPSFSVEPDTYTIELRNSSGEVVGTATDVDLETTVPSSGVYKVLVNATQGGTDYTNGVFVLLEDPITLSDQFIVTLVTQLLLDGLPFDYSSFYNLKIKWLTILAPNFDPPIEPTTSEEEIPFLYKFLIAHLIVRDILLALAQKYLTSATFSQTSEINQSSSGGAIKKIVSGPIETEYFGEDDSSGVQQVLKTAFIPGGMFDSITSTGCSIASNLNIYLSHCPNPSDVLYVPKKLELNDFYSRLG